MTASEVCADSTCAVENITAPGGGTHTWWVQTYNSAGYGPWSSGLVFSIGAVDATATATATLPATETATMTPSATPAVTDTPSATPTNTATATATFTPTSGAVVFANAVFTYDGDGKRVKSTINGAETTYFVGTHYEVTGGVVTKYYYAGAQRIAMRTGTTLSYLLSDHLGSTSLTTDASGNVVSELRYKAWGEVRYSSGAMPTAYQYTGQYSYASDFGLLFYNARWYDPALGRFAQADTIIPGPSNLQAWDRYAYSFNNPLIYVDPTGHDPTPEFITGFLKELARTNFWFHPGYQKDLAIQNNESDAELAGRLVADVVSMVVGIAEAGGGTGIAGGGVVACGTVVLCLGGAPAIAGGGVLIAQGAGTTLNAADSAGTIIAMLSRGSGNGSNEPDFENEHLLQDHFDDHKDEFGYQTPEEYLSGARNLFKGGKGIETFYRKNDGATLFFNKNTNEFGVLNADGTIGTYMIPENGIYYWWKQIGKEKK